MIKKCFKASVSHKVPFYTLQSTHGFHSFLRRNKDKKSMKHLFGLAIEKEELFVY